MEFRKSIIICGDFNARIGGNIDGRYDFCCGKFKMNGDINDNGERMIELCRNLELVVSDTIKLPVTKYNHGSWYHCPSKKWFALDHILVNKNMRERIEFCEVDNQVENLWSDHKPVRLQLTLKKKYKMIHKKKEKNLNAKIYRDWIWVKEDEEHSRMLGEKMDELLLAEEKNVEGDLTYEDICKTILKVMEEIPEAVKEKMNTKGVDEKGNEDRIRQMCNKRRNVFRYYDKCKGGGDKLRQQQMKLKVRKIKHAMQRLIELRSNKFHDERYRSMDTQSTKFHSQQYWDETRFKYGAINAIKSVSAFLKKDGSLTKNEEEVLERLYEHAKDLLNQEGIVAINIDEYIRFVKIDVRTSLGADFEMWEYHLAVYEMNERKQTGEDEIPIEVCKLIPSEKLKEVILKMINNNLRNGSTPQGMKSALIAYLHKKGDTTITDNYRTLSLLSHIGKIQERMILKEDWMNSQRRLMLMEKPNRDFVTVVNVQMLRL